MKTPSIKLKVIISKDGLVKLRILSMNEKFRAFSTGSEFSFSGKNGYEIFSCASPELDYQCLYLRGYDDILDYSETAYYFSSLIEARKQIEKMKKALAEFVKVGFNEKAQF